MDIVCQQAGGVARANWYEPSSIPLFSLTLVSPLISHPLADAFEVFSHDLESAKTHLEVAVESRKTSDRENEAPEAAERIQRKLAELCEKYNEGVTIRTNIERYAYSSSCLSSPLSLYQKKKKTNTCLLGPARPKLTMRCKGAARSGEQVEREAGERREG